MSLRSLIQRTCVAITLIALSVYLFYIGKAHVLLIDTNSITIDNEVLRSHASATIRVNDIELRSPIKQDERVSVTVSGSRHTLVIVDDSDTDIIIKRNFTIPTFMERAIVSIPAIIANVPEEHWVNEFIPPRLQEETEEKMQFFQIGTQGETP
jgi:hypothetical protein